VLATYYVAQLLIARNAAAVTVGTYSANSSPALLGGVTPR
jgi:hypothetical protein